MSFRECIGFSDTLKHIARQQNDADQALYHAEIKDRLRIALNHKLNKEELVRQEAENQ